MALSKEERVRELAQLVGIHIAPDEEAEVANRFDSLVQELERLTELELDGIEPVSIFPEESDDAT